MTDPIMDWAGVLRIREIPPDADPDDYQRVMFPMPKLSPVTRSFRFYEPDEPSEAPVG